MHAALLLVVLCSTCCAFRPKSQPLKTRKFATVQFSTTATTASYLDSLSQQQLPEPIGTSYAVSSQLPIVESTGQVDGRRPILAGNWKLNPATEAEASNLLKLLHANFVNHRSGGNVEVVVFPPFPFLAAGLDLLQGSGIKVGAQNIGLQTSGAYTGEVSAGMIRSMGVEYVMLGHSERRVLFGETDEDINKKIHLALDEAGLNVILCVGETEEEYESQLLASVCDIQIRKGLKGMEATDLGRIVIAYEPVWAIGTGKVASPAQAQAAHLAIRKTLGSMFGDEAAGRVRIQYGGSVNPGNVDDLMGMPDVDGALVGGASLTADSFSRIVDGAASAIGF